MTRHFFFNVKDGKIGNFLKVCQSNIKKMVIFLENPLNNGVK